MIIFKLLFDKEVIWHKRADLIEALHLTRTIQNPLWRISNTAEEIKMSTGFVSEEIKLAKAMRENPKLRELSRNKALKKIKS